MFRQTRLLDRKSTRLNSSHRCISYAVFCLKKKNRLPFEQKTNPYIANDPKLINFKYFFTRKLMFVRSSHAVALFPVGFGTMAEGFEVLTLIQTGKSVPMPIIFVDRPGGDYWQMWQDYVIKQLLGRGLIGED